MKLRREQPRLRRGDSVEQERAADGDDDQVDRLHEQESNVSGSEGVGERSGAVRLRISVPAVANANGAQIPFGTCRRNLNRWTR